MERKRWRAFKIKFKEFCLFRRVQVRVKNIIKLFRLAVYV